MNTARLLLILLALVGILSAPTGAHDSQAAEASNAATSDAETYSFRYKFQPGETVRWEVTHQARIRSTVSGTTEVTEMVT